MTVIMTRPDDYLGDTNDMLRREFTNQAVLTAEMRNAELPQCVR